MNEKIKSISAEKFKEKLGSGEFTLVDVRTQSEHDQIKIADSIVVDVTSSDFLENLKKLDKSKKYLIYCASGARSGHTLSIMEEEGFAEAYDLDGGIMNYE